MKEYDLILSLGGSCAVAYQLQAHDLRPCANPFDWLFSGPDVLPNLATSFRNHFRNWLLPENLRRLNPNEMRGGGTQYQYIDLGTGYRFIHSFTKPMEEIVHSVRETSMRRIDRLCTNLDKASSIALCYDSEKPVAHDHVGKVKNAILERFGCNKDIDIVIWEFSSERLETIDMGNGFAILRFPYPRHEFMYHNKSFEFDIMDNWCLSGKIKGDYRGKGKYLYLSRNSKGWKLLFFRERKKVLNIVLTTKRRKFEVSIGGK